MLKDDFTAEMNNPGVILGGVEWFETVKDGIPEISTHLMSPVHKDIVTKWMEHFQIKDYSIRTSSIVGGDEILSLRGENIIKLLALNPRIADDLEKNTEKKKTEAVLRRQSGQILQAQIEAAEEVIHWARGKRNANTLDPQTVYSINKNETEKLSTLISSLKTLKIPFRATEDTLHHVLIVHGADNDKRLIDAANNWTKRQLAQNALHYAATPKKDH